MTWFGALSNSSGGDSVSLFICVCVILCSKETTHKHSRGCRAQWRRHPTKLCTCAWSRAWSALCTCFCDKIASSFYQGFRLFRYLRLFMLVGKNTCYRPFTLRFWATWLTSPCRSLHGCIHPSDKCVFAGRFPKATRWPGSRCDPRESRHCKNPPRKTRQMRTSYPLSLG